jgi:hypothetical protein
VFLPRSAGEKVKPVVPTFQAQYDFCGDERYWASKKLVKYPCRFW